MAYKLIDAATTTGVSPTITFRQLTLDHSLQITINASVTAATVGLEGSLDGVNFNELLSYPLSAGDLTANEAFTFLEKEHVRYIRANVKTLTGVGGTITVLYDTKENNGG